MWGVAYIMKRNLNIALLAIITLLCCGCAASKDASSEILYDTVADVLEDGAYSMERSSATSEAETTQGMETEPTVCQVPLVYVSFLQHSGSASADDGTKLFISQYSVPQFVTENEDVTEWLQICVDNAAAKTADELKLVEKMAESIYENREEGDPVHFYAYSFYSNVSTARMDDTVVSVLQVNSVYSGGAHPNSAQQAYNLDLQNCIELTLSDVILPDGADVLQEQVLTRLSERFGSLENSGLYPDYQEVVKGCFDDDGLTSNWYFSENGLVIYFNCYDIAPYAAGIIKVEIPYEMLEGVVKPVYLPESVQGSSGEIDVLDSVDGYKVLVGSGEGEMIFVGTDQTVYDIKLYKLTGWLTDDVPIGGAMVFAANRLAGGEAIGIPNLDDLGYLLSYSNGSGDVQKLVISAGGVREIANEIAE